MMKLGGQGRQSQNHYGPRIIAAILTILVLSILDAVFTMELVRRGATELNPVLAYYINRSELGFFGVKYFLTWASITLILLYRNTYLFKTRVQAKMVLIFFIICFALVIQWELSLIF